MAKTKTKTPGKLILPAVKGTMGDRDYFLTTVGLRDIVSRVQLAKDIVSSGERPSKRLQRDINDKRFVKISKYLREKEGRFFNALVVGVYGAPKWRHFSDFSLPAHSAHKERIGFLEFSGDEKMYALDGQHRLRGIGVAINGQDPELLPMQNETIGVVFVEHRDTKDGIARSRRLFVDLNKHPQKVSTRDIIYLDEDDLVAIITRKLIEKRGKLQMDTRVHTAPERAMHDLKSPCFTTIVTLYNCIKALLKKVFVVKNLEVVSVSEKSEAVYLAEEIEIIFDMIEKYTPPLRKYFNAPASQIGELAVKYRNNHVLFRPGGLRVFVEVICEKYNEHGRLKKYDKKYLESVIKEAAELPLSLNAIPAAGLVWQKETKKINPLNFKILKQIYRYMLGLSVKDGKPGLEKKYRGAIGDDKAKLPAKL